MQGGHLLSVGAFVVVLFEFSVHYHACGGRPALPRGILGDLLLNPVRILRRRQRLEREALEEAQFLRRRHGEGALDAARDQQLRPEVTTWGYRVLDRAIQLLKSKV